MDAKRKKIIGIQGGEGSYNHQAVTAYCKSRALGECVIQYLYETKSVLDAIEGRKVDFGQFAIVNSQGGLVNESIDQLGNYRFKVVDSYQLEIRHCLLARKGTRFDQIKRIMAHDQAIRQCARNLELRCGGCELIAGNAGLIDTAQIALALSEGKLGGEAAMIGSKDIAAMYGLDILQEDLQDSKKNITTFLFVAPR